MTPPSDSPTPTPPPLTERAQVRLAEIRTDISTRLWPVNIGMSSASFNELMDQMSLLQLRFELSSSGARPVDTRRGPNDRRVGPPAAPSSETPPGDPPTPGAAPRDSSGTPE